METKTCNKCKKSKVTSEFFRNNSTKDKLHRICKACARETKRLAYQSLSTEERRHHNYKWSKNSYKKYGLTADQAMQLKESGCEICGSTCELCIDHDHKLGRPNVRGVLCRFCNFGIGLFRDQPELLQKAAIYLNKKAPEL